MMFLERIFGSGAVPKAPRPGDTAAEAALRQSLALPRLINPLPDQVRLNRISDEALRVVRRQAAREADFGWLLAPRVAAALVAMLVAGSAVGAGWPATAPTTQSDEVALLDIPLTSSSGMAP
jgi:hypothetical protein